MTFRLLLSCQSDEIGQLRNESHFEIFADVNCKQKMSHEGLRLKILRNEICRLCLSDNEELVQLNDEDGESQLKPEELIEKFNLVEVKIAALYNLN